MRFKFYTFVFGICIVITTVLLLYQVFSIPADIQTNEKRESVALLESRLHRLEDEISTNHQTIAEIRSIFKQMSKENVVADLIDSIPSYNTHPRNQDISSILFNLTKSSVHQDDCAYSLKQPSSVDIQMKDIFDILPFDNPDGGAWKQGWDIEYDRTQWSPKKKLKVFVVPHSHNDPGWIKTFERYLEDQTMDILDNMVIKLSQNRKMKFIWAEISFFAAWWDRQTAETKNTVRKLAEIGQFEIVTGGWVMPDEAATHFYATHDQLLTGHQWVQMNLHSKPSNGWAIDPFGMSPTMAYVLKSAGLQNMLIQRTHYSIKKYLSKEKSLEFRWRQIWDTTAETDILCHMMPFYNYDVPHTCGPDPKVCCQFDFKRFPGSGMHCPWKIPPKAIDDSNVEYRSELILNQYRKKAQLYKTDVLLVPLGDDFRYDKAVEWDNQYVNYQKLFDYLNSRNDWHVEAQFGTLSDYFRALREENVKLSGDEELGLPSLSGDFFSYADRDDHYWTGYFTNRPFYKRLDRTLQSYMRTAEILFALMLDTETHSKLSNKDAFYSMMHDLTIAHQDMGLFQHHDGITGTAKPHVMADYAKRMLNAIETSQSVIEQAVKSVLHKMGSVDLEEASIFKLTEEFSDTRTIPTSKVIHLAAESTKTIYVLNSEAHRRQNQVSIVTSYPFVEVRDRSGEIVLCQVDPVFDFHAALQPDKYEVTFIINVDPLSLTAFSLHGIDAKNVNYRFTAVSEVRVRQLKKHMSSKIFTITEESAEPFKFTTKHHDVEFSKEGLMQRLTSLSHRIDCRIKFIFYNSRGSGAYIFIPRGDPVEVSMTSSTQVIVKGPLRSSVDVFSPTVRHQIIFRNSPGVDGLSPSINNYVDVRRKQDYELAMHVTSSIKNGNTFYTDLNGFQIIKRTRYQKLPLQANYYPITTQMYIEDGEVRLSIVTAQPLGGTSLQEGQFEMMLDRTVTQDDQRGLGEGIRDNVLILNSFNLVLEKSTLSEEFISKNLNPTGYPSMAVNFLSLNLLHPLHFLHTSSQEEKYMKHWSVGGELPCDINLVSLRTLLDSSLPGATHPPSSSLSLTLHRVGFTCSLPTYGEPCVTTNGKFKLSDLFPGNFGDKVTQMSLTHLYEGVSMSKSYMLFLKPMHMQSYRLSYSRNLTKTGF